MMEHCVQRPLAAQAQKTHGLNGPQVSDESLYPEAHDLGFGKIHVFCHCSFSFMQYSTGSPTQTVAFARRH